MGSRASKIRLVLVSLLALAALSLSPATALAAPSTVESESVSNVTATDATLEAQIDPGGLQTEYRFRVLAAPCNANPLNCEVVHDPLFPSPPAKLTSTSGPATATLDLNAAGLTLEPGTEYHYAVIASNSDGAEAGPDQTFATLAAPRIDSESVTHVTPTNATLEATIEPRGGRNAFYQFQLVKNPSEYPSEILCPPPPYQGYSACQGTRSESALPIGSICGECEIEPAAMPLHLDLAEIGVTLEPGTSYHFRVLAANAVQTEDSIRWEEPTVFGPDRSFRTQEFKGQPPGDEHVVTCAFGSGCGPNPGAPPNIRHQAHRCAKHRHLRMVAGHLRCLKAHHHRRRYRQLHR